MCGIAGIIKWTTDRPAPWAKPTLDYSTLANMSTCLIQRGPDDDGMWVDPRPNSIRALVHRRLAIVDIHDGLQPMSDKPGEIQVVFNGEIYNHAALRKELQHAGHVFTTDHSDTEVLIHGWRQWGADLPRRLRGMFAFAIYDLRDDTLFLARDRIGQKPLFIGTLDDGLVFGSNIPSVLAWPEVPRRTSPEHLSHYLMLGYFPPPWTIYRDITQVMPGHYVMLKKDVLSGGPYWRLGGQNPPPQERTPEQWRHELRWRVKEAIRSQLMADVPLACFLSGGIDSTIIATLMQEIARESGAPPIQTVSVGFAEAGYDESAIAQTTAARIGSRHTRVKVDAHQDVMGTLEYMMRQSLGQPFGDSSILPTYHLSNVVRQIAPVALSGDGGDELFAGYDRYRAIRILEKWRHALNLIPPFGNPRRRERIRRMAYASRGASPAERYQRITHIWHEHDTAQLIAPPPQELFVPPADHRSPLRDAMTHDLMNYLPGDVLWKVDSASMSVGLEVRSPFMDHGLIELTQDMPDAMLIHGHNGKQILRQAFAAELPGQITQRGKQGFAVPIGTWFRNDLAPQLREILFHADSMSRNVLNTKLIECVLAEHITGRRDHTHRLFSLLMLELWQRSFGARVEM